MKKLMTVIAAIAFTSAISAQNSCTVTTACGAKTYETSSSVRISNRQGVVTITDSGNGEVLDTFTCEGRIGASVSCSSSSTSAPTAPTTPAPTRTPRRPRGGISITTSGNATGTATITTTIGGVTTTRTRTSRSN